MSYCFQREYPWPPRIQVAGVSSLEEALVCRSLGVEALGFTLDVPGGVHDGLTRRKAKRIIERLPQDVLAVAITYLTDAREAGRLITEIGAQAIQFHGGISDDQIRLFRDICPHARTIGRVTVSGPESLFEADGFQPPLWDALILDSHDPATGRKGATGLTHNWNISRQIVARSSIPVILAGGLTSSNVGRAIIEVSPHGVDAHTGLEESDGARSMEKIHAFVKAALEAFGRQKHDGCLSSP